MDTQKIIELEEKLLMRTYSRPKIVIDKGKGCYVFDKEGKRYIDLVGGLATCLIGHGNRQFSEAIKKPFNPMLEGFKHVEFGNASAAEKAITKNTAAIMVEPIQGEAGVIVPRQDYLKHLREI